VVVDGETGLLVKPGNIEALATALGDVLVNPGFAKKLADGCRRHRDKWGTQSYVRRLEEIYAALVEGRPITAIQDLANCSKL
jgi:glycosyltransferase involved in cell wall biosynthesis